VPSPHGLRYCILVIDHHSHFIWVKFTETKDESCGLLEAVLLEIKHLHAKHHATTSAFAPILDFDSDTVFDTAETLHLCARLGVGTQFSAPYAHKVMGKAERP
jgi:hypothetical protein